MSVQIIKEIPTNYKLLYKFNKYCKLYRENRLTYICSIIVPWYDKMEKFIRITLKDNTIKNLLSPSISEKSEGILKGFAVEEIHNFSKSVLESCNIINDSLSNNNLQSFDFYTKFTIEQIAMPFFSNTILLYLNKKNKKSKLEWNRRNKLLYGLSQIIFTAYCIIYINKHYNYELHKLEKNNLCYITKQ